MLRLVGGPSTQRFVANSVRSELHRQRGFATYDSITFIRLLRRMCLAVPQAVTTPNVMASSVVR